MNKVNWTAVAVFIIVVLLAFLVGASLLGGRGYGGWGMMGPWMMGGMFFMWLIPLGFLVLTVLGIAWLVRTIGGGNNPVVPSQACPSCGRSVQADWRNCPHCGAQLTK